MPQVFNATQQKFGKAINSFSVSTNNSINYSCLLNDNNWLGVCAYKDGYFIMDVSNPDSIYSSGYYKTTAVLSSNPKKAGAMYCTKQLKSGNVLVADAREGLMILDVSKAIVRPIKLNYPNFIQIYPNPSDDIITIKLKRDYYCTLKVINKLGIEVFKKEYTQSIDDNISVKDFIDGLYIFQIKGPEGQLTQKVIIKH